MLNIRFQRVGRRNDPAFRLIVTEHQDRPKTNGLETLGSYHPKTKVTVLKNERILHWMSKGAQTSDSVKNLLISKGVIQGKKIAVTKPLRKPDASDEARKEETPAGSK